MTFFISGYFKNDRSEFENYVVSSEDYTLDDDDEFDDCIFFYGLSEDDIKKEIILGEETEMDFVITSYSK